MDPETTLPDDYDISETSGMDDLRAALGADSDAPPWESVEETPPVPEDGTGVPDNTGNGQGDGDDTPPQLTDEDVRRVLSDSNVQAQMRRAYDNALAQDRQRASERLEWERAQRQAEEEELLLDDEEYGRKLRSQQQMQPVLQRAQAAGYAQAQNEFFQLGVGSVFSAVGELRDLSSDEKVDLDPSNPRFRSYGDFINAVVDKAAAKRAETIATKMAEDMTKARVSSELTKIRKGSPSPRGVPGPSSGPGPIVDLEKMSGDELLKIAFRDS